MSFRESFLLICLCFLLAMGPMLWLCRRRARLQEPVSVPPPGSRECRFFQAELASEPIRCWNPGMAVWEQDIEDSDHLIWR